MHQQDRLFAITAHEVVEANTVHGYVGMCKCRAVDNNAVWFR